MERSEGINQAAPLASLPNNWSGLSWQQLTACWEAKMRYAGTPDVARAAALLALLGCKVCRCDERRYDDRTDERQFFLLSADGTQWTVTSRVLSQLARQSVPFVDYPYGDPGEPAVRDEKGKVTKEARDPVNGLVNPAFRDALALPETELTVDGIVFALLQVACNNLTWQQYRSLQATVSQLFAEGIDDKQTVELQAHFLAHILVPEQPHAPSADRFAPVNI